MKRILLILVSLIVLFAAFEFFTFPDVAALAKENPQTTAFMKQRKRALERAGKNTALEHRWVPYDRISPYLRRAVLVSEDNSFYEHEGVDVEGLKEALKKDWEKRQLHAGGSTITQQLAKNLYLTPSKNPYRKFKEFLIARELEQELSKKRILEIYLNVVEFGETVYGAEAAARHFFKKSAANLTPREAALLAGCLPNPRVMRVDAPNKRLKARQRIILSRMRRWGYTLEKEVLTSKPKKADPSQKPSPEPAEQTETSVDTSVPDAVNEPEETKEERAAPETGSESVDAPETPTATESTGTSATGTP